VRSAASLEEQCYDEPQRVSQDNDPPAESLAKALYRSLTGAQRNEICFPWDYRDQMRGLLRSFIANHWQVTRPCVRSDFFTPEQQALIHQIFQNLVDPAWYPLFLRQLADDTKRHAWGRDQSIAIIGDIERGPYQFLFTGRHITLRADGGSSPDLAFGGPIVYAHAATGFWEKPHHPGNIFWPQAEVASRLYEALDASQREQAEVDALPEEPNIGFRDRPQGLSVATLSPPQKILFAACIESLMAPYRAAERDRVRHCIARQGGEDSL
jgi:hypothetical protein